MLDAIIAKAKAFRQERDLARAQSLCGYALSVKRPIELETLNASTYCMPNWFTVNQMMTNIDRQLTLEDMKYRGHAFTNDLMFDGRAASLAFLNEYESFFQRLIDEYKLIGPDMESPLTIEHLHMILCGHLRWTLVRKSRLIISPRELFYIEDYPHLASAGMRFRICLDGEHAPIGDLSWVRGMKIVGDESMVETTEL